MAIICPTVTAETPADYAAALTQASEYAARIHIDVADGKLAPRKLLSPSQIYLPPKECIADIHVMYESPMHELMTLISLRPHMVILHAEAKGDILGCLKKLQKAHIKAGIALLPHTDVAAVKELVAQADYVLIFAGNLGYQGGAADMTQLHKVTEIRALNSHAEIAWDGGINDQNARTLAAAGIDVLNVGGFIHHAPDPAAAFRQLTEAVL